MIHLYAQNFLWDPSFLNFCIDMFSNSGISYHCFKKCFQIFLSLSLWGFNYVDIRLIITLIYVSFPISFFFLLCFFLYTV